MATPSSSNPPPSLPTPAAILTPQLHKPEPSDGQAQPCSHCCPERELPPEWQWQRYLDLSG